MCNLRNVFLVAASVLIFDVNSLEDSILDSGIVITEEIIRNTTNKLFSSFKLKRDNTRLNQYIIINKHFASVSLQDHDTLNEIARLSRANSENSNTTNIFMKAINELLDVDNLKITENEIKNDEITQNNIPAIIETFLKRLRQARELHDVNSYGKINENILNLVIETRVGNTTLKNQEDENYNMTNNNNNTASDEIEFWKPSGRRIYGGERTKIKHFPFMASIQMFNNFQCSGSIIKSDLIITASSCLQLAWNNRFFRENPAFLSVRVGSSFYGGGGEVIPILEVYFHPTYEPKTLKNNICIVRLTRKINFSWRARRRVRKIDIDRHPYALPFNTPGITILGWGAKGRSNIVRDPWKNILSFAVLDIYPLRDCQEIYSKEYVTRKNFCAGFISRGGGACNRDIGGPGIDDGTLVGVVSFGSPVCGAADAPTVFTKLGYYADWIDDIMEQEVPSSKKRTTLKPPKHFAVRHTPVKSTTFKIPPLPGGKMKPIPINDIDNVLRMFDYDLFQEFMRTMFDSKEMAEYKDVLSEVQQDMVNKILEDEKQLVGKKESKERKELLKNKKQTPQGGNQLNKYEPHRVTSPYIDLNAEPATKLVELETESLETATQSDYSNKYTVLDEDISSKTDKVENDIADIIKNINLKQIIEEETIAAKKKDVANALVTTESIFFNEMGSLNDVSNKNESVLTLLYLSEEQKNKEDKNLESGEKGKGLSIATDYFQDMTRSKSKNIYNDLPEEELYEILSEVIDDEIRNNETGL